MTAIFAILSLAAWLPVMSQQAPLPAPAAPATKSNCTCCDHQKAQGDQADAGKGISCCQGKDMACCKKDKDSKSAMNCCSGKDAKQCAKDGKGCCGKAEKSCCGKDAMACNSSKNGKGCCGGDSTCCHRTQS
ncbi:MAG TPA: hypothetical protein VMH20_14965 [Verrucomicrobiae bacterium]|nr:hypothetical protein [Verrucomicrobiae bacterium]